MKNSHNASIHHQMEHNLTHHQMELDLEIELIFIDIIDLYVTFNLNQIFYKSLEYENFT